MSSLRVDSLRICWLEAFIAVEQEEDISAAARALGVNQSTVSRYMQALENWLGEKLIKPGGVSDPEDARLSIEITKYGRAFHEIAQRIVSELNQFRTHEARYREKLEDIEDIVRKLEQDLAIGGNAVIESIRPNIESFRMAIEKFDTQLSMNILEAYRRNIRKFYSDYIRRIADDKRRRKNKVPK